MKRPTAVSLAITFLRWKKARRVAEAALAIASLLAVARAQPTAPVPDFELATVRLVPRDQHPMPSLKQVPGRLDYRGIPLGDLVLRAYDLPYYRVVWPPKLDAAQQSSYDISALLPAGVGFDQLGPMLQRLLAQRLSLRSHWESRNLKGYSVNVSKTGLKMPRSVDPSTVPDDPNEKAEVNRYQVMQMKGGERITGPMSVGQLLAVLGRQLGRPMQDQTELKGYFDVDLRWSKAYETPPQVDPSDAAATPPPHSPASEPAYDLLPSLEKQLGLTAQAATFPAEILVIDGVTITPRENN